jgi:hypothetical protein
MNFIVRFGLFWWDFIVGDSIALAVGTLVALGLAYGLANQVDSLAAEILLPVAIIATLIISLRE